MGEVKKLQRPPLERVVIVDPVHEDAIVLLSQEFEVEVHLYPSEDELLELLERADIVVLRSGVRLSAAVIQAAPRLRIIARAGVGLDNIDIDAARAAGIAVFNVPDATTRAVAEFAIGLILALARKIPQADAAMRAGRWEKPQLEGVELRGRALGVVGFGRIGSEIGAVGQAIGMQVIAAVSTPSSARRDALAAAGVQLTDLHDLLCSADVVCLAVPLTPQTHGLIGRDELGMMKPGSYLVNVARGDVVNTQAVCDALRSGQLAGAALDVHGEDSDLVPLASLANVVLTPHIGAMTVEAQRRVATALARSIAAARNGEHDPHRIC